MWAKKKPYRAAHEALFKFFREWRIAIGKPLGEKPELFPKRFLDFHAFQELLEEYAKSGGLANLDDPEWLEARLIWTHGECFWVALMLQAWLHQHQKMECKIYDHHHPCHAFLRTPDGYRIDGVVALPADSELKLYRARTERERSKKEPDIVAGLAIDLEGSVMYHTFLECHEIHLPVEFELHSNLETYSLDALEGLLEARRKVLETYSVNKNKEQPNDQV